MQLGATNNNVHANPFCSPPTENRCEEVQLASGNKGSARKLKPIGKAVGLRSLEPTSTQSAMPQIVSGAKLTIEPVTPSIQQNPLIESTHHADRPLVETAVTDGRHSDDHPKPSGTTTILLKPPAHVRSGNQPASAPDTAAVKPPVTRQESSDDSLPAPIRFSLSDNGADSAGNVLPEAEIEDAQIIPAATPEPPLLPSSGQASVHGKVDSRVEGPSPAEPNAADASSSLATKRYRPPVAVTAVPLVIQRDDNTMAATAAVRAVPNLQLGRFESQPATSDSTPLQLGLAQVRSLTLGGKLRSVEVADSAVCKAIATGPSQLKLIGSGNGVTRLVVWAETPHANPQPQCRVFEVHVGQLREESADSLGQAARLLNRSIDQAFQNCRVTVMAHGSELTVAGRCDSERSAKKILRLVRKTCLVPVNDQLMID